jgi:hypothetical protein
MAADSAPRAESTACSKAPFCNRAAAPEAPNAGFTPTVAPVPLRLSSSWALSRDST